MNKDNILTQERIIEDIEDRIQRLTKEKKKYPQPKERYSLKPLLKTLGYITGFIVAFPIVGEIFLKLDPSLKGGNPVFESVENAINYFLTTFCFGLPIPIIATWCDYKNFKEDVKKGEKISSKLDDLQLQKDKEQEKLVDLQMGKTSSKEEPEIRYSLTDAKQQLIGLKRYLEKYRSSGYKQMMARRYYKLDDFVYRRPEEKGTSLVMKNR